MTEINVAVIIAKQAKTPPKADRHIVRAMWICPQAPVSSRCPTTWLPTATLLCFPFSTQCFLDAVPPPPPPLLLAQLSHSTSALPFCSLLCQNAFLIHFQVLELIPLFNFLPLIQKRVWRAYFVLGRCWSKAAKKLWAP